MYFKKTSILVYILEDTFPSSYVVYRFFKYNSCWY